MGTMGIKEWLNGKIKASGMGPVAIAKEITARGTSVTTGAVSKWANGKTVPSPIYCELLAQIFKERPEFVLDLAGHRAADDAGRIPTIEDGFRMIRMAQPYEIPLIGYASAGPGAPIDPIYAAPSQRGRRIYQAIVTGDCMSPALERGDRVIFDEDLIPQPGDLIVAQREDERIVKRYHGDEFRGDDGSVVNAAGWDILGTVFRSVKIWRQHRTR